MNGLSSVLGNASLDKLLEELTRLGWPVVLPLVRLYEFINSSLSGRAGRWFVFSLRRISGADTRLAIYTRLALSNSGFNRR